MAAILFLLVASFFGLMLVYTLTPGDNRLFFAVSPRKRFLREVPQPLFFIPAGIMVGMLISSFVTYWVTYFIVAVVPSETSALNVSALIVSLLLLFFGIIMLQKRLKKYVPIYAAIAKAAKKGKKQEEEEAFEFGDEVAETNTRPLPRFTWKLSSFIFYGVSLLLFIAAVSYLFYRGLYRSGDNLHAGYSVFSDLAPHTALVSSFSRGLNFPTQYPHFPGDGINYHFLFFFMSGILNSLGLSLEHALNIPAILSMISCFTLLGTLGVLITGKKVTFFLSGLFILFRHNLYFIQLFSDAWTQNGGDLGATLSAMFSRTEWFGNTPFDSWGIWAVNVYSNQRHLMFGLSLLLIVLFFFLPHVRRMFISLSRAGKGTKLKTFFIAKGAWLPTAKDPLKPWSLLLLSCIIVVCMPYMHGSILICLMLILLVMAIFSRARLLYLITAVCAVVSSILQTSFFSGGAASVTSFSYNPGFVVEDPGFATIFQYLFGVFGIVIPLIAITLIQVKGMYRRLILLSFLAPAVFAFFFQVSKEMLANHKFLQVSLILIQIFIAGIIALLLFPFDKNPRVHDGSTHALADETGSGNISAAAKRPPHALGKKIATVFTRIFAGLLTATLLITGVLEWSVYHNINRNAIIVPMHHPVTEWIIENTNPRSVFLTEPFAINAFFLSGRFSYYGHPYYAWSAGSDTDGRWIIYKDLLSGFSGDLEKFLQVANEENISYVLMNDALRNIEEITVDEEFFRSNFTAVTAFPNIDNTVIYKIPKV